MITSPSSRGRKTILSTETRDVGVSRGRAESFSENVDFDEEAVVLDPSSVLSILWWTMYSPEDREI